MEFRLLGPVEAWHDGAAVALGRRRERCLLGILLLEPGVVIPTERLVDLLWDSDPPSLARASLRAHVSRLRHLVDPGDDGALGIRIQGRGGGYAADVDPDRVDAYRFRTLLAEARADPAVRPARLREALELWRGPLLADVASDRLRDRVGGDLADSRMAAMELAIEADLDADRAEDAVADLIRLVHDHPLREGLRVLLMLALYRCGRAAEALDVFRDARELLNTELGIEPGPELQTMHRRILSRDPHLAQSASAPARNDLPRDVADFTGRDAELGRLLAMLPDSTLPATTVTISAIDGMAGIGKTTLAVHAAHRLADRYPDALLYLDLRAHTAGQEPVDPAAALDRLLRAIGVAAQTIPDGLDERAALWRAELVNRRAIVILDNAASATQVRPLLPGASPSLTMITSRQRLADLEATSQISLDVLPAADAAVLFARVVGDARPANEPDQVAVVARLCGYLPLAIRIAAARLRSRPTWTVAHLAERLADRQHRLAELEVGDNRIAAAFAMSYERLTIDQQRMFRRLGLMPVPDFDAYLAAALAETASTTAGRVLEELVDANLVQARAPGRYRMHDLLREHAATVAGSDEPVLLAEAATGRGLDYYRIATAEAMALLDRRGGQLSVKPTEPPTEVPPMADLAAARAWLDTEHANLVLAVDLAAGRGYHTHAWQLAHLLQYYFSIGAHTNDWLATHEIALASTRELGDGHAEAEIRRKLGLGYAAQGRYAEALEQYDRTLALFRATGDQAGEGLTLNSLGNAYERMDRYDEALHHYQQALALRVASGNRRGQGAGLMNLGNVYAVMGRNVEALDHYRRALAMFEDLADQRNQAIVLTNIGVIEERLGDLDTALDHHEQSLVLHQAQGDRPFIGVVLTNMGTVLRRKARHEESLEHHLQALAVARETSFRPLECEILNNLGDAYSSAGRTADAIDAHRSALGLAIELGSRREEARAHHALGDLLAATDHWNAALAIYDDLRRPEADLLRERLAAL